MDDFDFDALIGHGSQLPAQTGKKKAREETPQEEVDAILKQVAGGKGSFVDAGELKRPVTRNFLALVFDMDQATVKKRLLTVKPVGFAGSGTQARPLYDFKEACSYLVEPKIDLDSYIKSLDANRLPNHINKMFWEAKKMRLRYMLEAGEAWRSEDVIGVFGRVFMLIKDSIQLWGETMREVCKLDDDQYARFKQMSDELQNNLHEQLVAEPKKHSTLSIAGLEAAGEAASEGAIAE